MTTAQAPLAENPSPAERLCSPCLHLLMGVHESLVGCRHSLGGRDALQSRSRWLALAGLSMAEGLRVSAWPEESSVPTSLTLYSDGHETLVLDEATAATTSLGFVG